ncbi:hypothetical protein MKZ20_19765 [Psychrobacillus sp. FSL K6-2684]|uniref:Apea-like HEPN domain-containing protein n=1 Tax=Psychrobacillus faecigallinarum TaxID=2762235 RepID=A0ABR8RCE4_9BACI|nr:MULTISPECIES: hypothetical protein [Psychrobacillus]MBD7945468.1 hypothetical protein [Psychrobacillus faecigallinarum]QEY21677.1 hypothetical protein D0S48_13905 [Psychrobacillus sp. AK 1817]
MEYKTKIRAFQNFRTEWSRVKKIYYVTIFSYEETISRVNDELETKLISNNNKFHYKNELISRSPSELTRNLSDRYANMLRESLFVRLISIMELYFNDVLLELGEITLNPFKTEGTKEYKVVDLLNISDIKEIQNEIIQNKVRNVVLGGYKEINKFLRTKLNINTANSNLDETEIKELYSRRNLLVHAGGIIDGIYFDNFIQGGSESVGKRLTVQEDYFIASLELVLNYVEFVTIKIEEVYDFSQLDLKRKQIKQAKRSQKLSNKTRELSCTIIFKSKQDILTYLDRQSEFGFDNKYLLGSILTETIEVEDFIVKLTVKGRIDIVGTFEGYYRMLKRKEIINDFTIIFSQLYTTTNDENWNT